MTLICRCLITRLIIPCLALFCLFRVGISVEPRSTLLSGQVMKDYETLVSPNGWFQLKFFASVQSYRYLGIESFLGVNNFMIWVANRDNPLPDSSGLLNITQNGDMVISDSQRTILVINPTMNSSSNSSLSLLNSGNLVLKHGDQLVWQSFDYLSDTWLPDTKLGLVGSKNRVLTSWRTEKDPKSGTGAYTLSVDTNNITKQLVIRKNGITHWQSGVYQRGNFYNTPNLTRDFLNEDFINFSFVSDKMNESYYTYSLLKQHLYPLVVLRLHSAGVLAVYQFVYLSNDGGRLTPQYSSPNCNEKDDGYSQGCVFPGPSDCPSGDQFSVQKVRRAIHDGYKFPVTNYSLSLTECKEICKKNCSCVAYTYAVNNDNTGDDGYGCEFFYRGWQKANLVNFIDDDLNGLPVYFRNSNTGKISRKQLESIGGSVAAVVALSILILLLLCNRRRIIYCCFGGRERRSIMKEMAATMAAIDKRSGAPKVDLLGKNDHELPLFGFSTIQLATDNFSTANKLGQGGFGPVFKGKLIDGQEIAVKRLSIKSGSGQGLEEFKNEIILLSRLQHRNLVKVLGCCIQGEERILVLEYLPNKSLDYFLFDATKRALLDWKKRMCIIEGIAQGLLYLHKYSRLKIIHRDLKSSNVLLDCNMNPKISDFGTARIFGEDESRANTRKVVGTYGYMSPEYAMDGIFSAKSDVFSFGVMMLEIITGKKNTGFYQSDRYLNLLGYVWDLWKEGRYLELVDQDLRDETSSADEATRCIHVGLLCVLESAGDRPTMFEVISMLSYEVASLPTPKQSAFLTCSSADNEALFQNPRPCSRNEITMSEIDGR